MTKTLMILLKNQSCYEKKTKITVHKSSSR